METHSEVPLPARVRLVQTEAGLEIHCRWFHPTVLIVLLLAVLWNGMTVLMYAGKLRGEPTLWAYPLLGLLAVCGLGLAYVALARLLNTTRIVVDAEQLSVRHGPLPWIGARQIERAQIAHVYSKQVSGPAGEGCHFEIWLVLRNGPQRKLVPNYLGKEQGLSIEQRLGRALGLAEHNLRRVEGAELRIRRKPAGTVQPSALCGLAVALRLTSARPGGLTLRPRAKPFLDVFQVMRGGHRHSRIATSRSRARRSGQASGTFFFVSRSSHRTRPHERATKFTPKSRRL